MFHWPAFLSGFLGKVLAALFIAVCVLLGFGPEQWAKWLIGDLISLRLARIGFFFLGALSLILLAANLLRARGDQSLKSISASTGERTPWEQEWHELRFRRDDFWRYMAIAMMAELGYGEHGPILHKRIADSAFPRALPFADGTDFPDWVWKAGSKFSGEAENLNRLASKIYPAVKPARSAKPPIMGGGIEWDKFDDVRRDLSKFWDHWGRQEPLEKIIHEQKADGLVKTSAKEIKMLTFLEIARERWAQDGGLGKIGLFRLGRRIADASESKFEISVGNETPFVVRKRNLYHSTKRVRIGLFSRSEMALTNCKLHLKSLNGSLASRCPFPIEQGFVLNPGEDRYIDVAEYDEPNDSMTGPNAISLIIPLNPLSNGLTHLPKERYELIFLATAAESLPCEITCQLYVDEEWKLHFEKI